MIGLALIGAPSVVAAEPPGDVDRQIDLAAGKLESVIEQYDAAREKLTTTRAKAGTLAAQLIPLRHRVALLHERVGGLASTLYKGGTISAATALISAQSPTELAEKLAILDNLVHDQQRQITALNTAKANLENQKKTLDTLLETQSRSERDLAAQKVSISTELDKLTTARWGDGRTSRSEVRDTYVPPFTQGKAGAAVQFAYAHLGTAYIFGAEGPRAFDCSGLTLAAWRAAGIQLPHSAAMQRAQTTAVSRNDLRPGDLVFYFDDLRHVGMYVGAGRVIHAPQPGERIKIAPLDGPGMPVHSFGRP